MDNAPDNPDEMPLEPADAPASNYESLAQFVISILILVIVISGTLNILLARLWKTSSTEVDAVRPQYQVLKDSYERNDREKIDKILATLQGYGATNPDYVPILAKYGFKPAGAGQPEQKK
jgi:hypothetical protein